MNFLDYMKDIDYIERVKKVETSNGNMEKLAIKYLEILFDAQRRALGLSTIAAALSEDEGTIEDVIEPYLLANGYIEKTAKGRIATDKAREALGHVLKTAERNLFEGQGG